MSIPRSPIACSRTCQPALSYAATARSSSSCVQLGSPVPPPAYGSNIAAVFASTTPST